MDGCDKSIGTKMTFV